MTGIKIWFDGLRQAPEGWIHIRRPELAIAELFKGQVTHVSLDHDMGADSSGTGYDVLLWLEQATLMPWFRPPVVIVHTRDALARRKMLLSVGRIARIERARRQCHLMADDGCAVATG